MSAHYDQVSRLPEGFETVARTQTCPIQAMVHKTKPVVGMQFHPEIEIERGRKCVRDEWEKLKQHGLDPDMLLAQIPVAPTGADRVLRNFLNFIS
jgi:GMP synthase-like glutamine amidotransferase